jgi:hypothetical protein
LKVAKRVSDSAHLTLEVASLANEYMSVRIDRVASNQYQLKAWSKASEVVGTVNLVWDRRLVAPNTPIALSGSVLNYSGKGVRGREVILLNDSNIQMGWGVTDSLGNYSIVLSLKERGDYQLVASCGGILSSEVKIAVGRYEKQLPGGKSNRPPKKQLVTDFPRAQRIKSC